MDFDVAKVSNNISCIAFWRQRSALHKLCNAAIFSISPRCWYASIYYPLIWLPTSHFFYHWCSSFASLLYCSMLLLLHFMVWLWSFIFIYFTCSTGTCFVIFCCMLELSVSSIETTSIKPLWVFTLKLRFRFSLWRSLFASVLWEIENRDVHDIWEGKSLLDCFPRSARVSKR